MTNKKLSLADQIRSVLLRHGEFLSLRDLLEECPDAGSSQPIAQICMDMTKRGECERRVNDAKRYEYEIVPDFRGAAERASTTALKRDAKRAAAAQAETPTPKPAAPVAVVLQLTSSGAGVVGTVVETCAPTDLPDGVLPGVIADFTPPSDRSRSKFYSMYDHVSHALSDLDDLTGDAIDNDAPKDVLKALVTAQGSLRRAQEALIRQQRQ